MEVADSRRPLLESDSSEEDSTMMPSSHEVIPQEEDAIDVSVEVQRQDAAKVAQPDSPSSSSESEAPALVTRRESPRLALKRKIQEQEEKRKKNKKQVPKTKKPKASKTAAPPPPPPPPVVPKHRGNGGAGRTKGPTYQFSEVDALLDILQDRLPASSDEWDGVTEVYNKQHPGRERDKDSLRRKFNSLHNKKVPTGDPSIPPQVKRAKYIMQEICARVDAGEGVDDEELGIEAEEAQIRRTQLFQKEQEQDVANVTASDHGGDGPPSSIVVNQSSRSNWKGR